MKKLPRANRVAPKKDEEDNDDPALASVEAVEFDASGKPVRKKPQPTGAPPAKAKVPAHGPVPPPAPPRPPRDER